MASLNYLWKNRAKYTPSSKQFYKAWVKRLLSFPELTRRNRRKRKLIFAGATISELAEIGEVRVEGSKRRLSIGDFSFLGKVELVLHDDITIGDRVCINDGVRLLTASHNVIDPEWKHVKKKIIIDDYVWIATGAIILPGVHLGRGAVIGAGAVVSKSVPPGTVMVGNPAKIVSTKRPVQLTYNPCAFLAANQAWLVG